jgi:hypothetical protein
MDSKYDVDYDDNTVYYSSNDYDDVWVDAEYEREIKQNTVIDQLYRMYKNTFETFRQGDLLVFNH